MSLKNRYDNVIIRNNLSLGLSHNALEYILNLEKENERLKQWDNNKDSRNSRQRIENKKLLEKNKHLQNNWNELKKWLEEQDIFITKLPVFMKEIAIEHKTMSLCYESILDKMQELERGEE